MKTKTIFVPYYIFALNTKFLFIIGQCGSNAGASAAAKAAAKAVARAAAKAGAKATAAAAAKAAATARAAAAALASAQAKGNQNNKIQHLMYFVTVTTRRLLV